MPAPSSINLAMIATSTELSWIYAIVMRLEPVFSPVYSTPFCAHAHASHSTRKTILREPDGMFHSFTIQDTVCGSSLAGGASIALRYYAAIATRRAWSVTISHSTTVLDGGVMMVLVRLAGTGEATMAQGRALLVFTMARSSYCMTRSEERRAVRLLYLTA